MDNPIFKLEGVVHERSAETLQDFEGPLDLILFLLSKNKIEIQDIPIALILEQYLAYLEQRKQLDLEVASEFITMAAHLMYIKTRMLLSIEDEEAQNEMEQLIQSLKERQQKDTYLPSTGALATADMLIIRNVEYRIRSIDLAAFINDIRHIRIHVYEGVLLPHSFLFVLVFIIN